jgi:hypothetical protein
LLRLISPFARDICGEAALFFKPMDPIDAAEKIIPIVAFLNDNLYDGYKMKDIHWKKELAQKGEMTHAG